MRVIGGQARGRVLKMPKGVEVRPITDMIKEALFNILAQEIPKSRFLDLFAGTGSVGIEALSRGARQVIFVDNNPVCVRAIQDNLDHCGFTGGYEIYRQDVIRALETLKNRGAIFDLIYIDPPFKQIELYERVWASLNSGSLLAADGRIIIRAPRNLELVGEGKELSREQKRKYGDSVLHFYKHNCREEL